MTYKGTKRGGLRRFPPKIFCFNIWTLPRQNLLTVPSPLYWLYRKQAKIIKAIPSQNVQVGTLKMQTGWDTGTPKMRTIWDTGTLKMQTKCWDTGTLKMQTGWDTGT